MLCCLLFVVFGVVVVFVDGCAEEYSAGVDRGQAWGVKLCSTWMGSWGCCGVHICGSNSAHALPNPHHPLGRRHHVNACMGVGAWQQWLGVVHLALPSGRVSALGIPCIPLGQHSDWPVRSLGQPRTAVGRNHCWGMLLRQTRIIAADIHSLGAIVHDASTWSCDHSC